MAGPLNLGAPHLGAVVVSYLLGSIPWGLVLVKLVKGIDLRTVGSGNIGATNAGRAGGKGLALAVFVLDFLKGWFPVWGLAPWAVGISGSDGPLAGWLPIACGAAAVLGHCYPVYLRFQGGKGVATGCGALVALDPVVFLIGGLVWLVTIGTTRFAGLASIAMGLAFPVAAWVRSEPGQREVVVGCTLLTLLILVRHRSNMARMKSGTEPRVWSRAGSEERS